MSITISQTYFANRTFATKLSYKKAVGLLCKISDKEKPDTNSKYINDIVEKFFDKNEFSFSKKAKSYFDCTEKELRKSDYAIFSIAHDNLKREFDSFVCNPISRLFGTGGILPELKKIRKEIDHCINFKDIDPELTFWQQLYRDIDDVISQSLNCTRSDYNSCVDYYKLVRERNARWKNDLSLHPKFANARIINKFSDFDKCLHDLEDYLTVKNIFASSLVKCIIVVSKTGFISTSFVVEYVGMGGLITVDSLQSVNDVVTEGIKKAEIINSRINSVPKLFSYIDFNHLLGLKSLLIIDNLAKDYNTHEEKNLLSESEKDIRNKSIVFNNHFPTYKCTHLRFAVDEIEKASKLPMFFYDYVSLLTAHNYSFDSLYLWNVVNKNDWELEKNDNITDYIGKPTEHMYIDDSSVLISVINPIVPNTILKDLSTVVLPSSSHQLRIYSLWRYMNACNALAFGGMAVLSSHLLDAVSVNYFSNYYNKTKMVYLYHKYSYLSSYVCSQFDIRHFHAKTSNMTVANYIFSKMNIDNLITARRQRTDELWRNANLSNTQLYNRYGLVLSITSLLIAILSYGLVSAVFGGEQKVERAIDFFNVVFSTPKFYFILMIASIPITMWIIVNVVLTIYRKTRFSIIKESKIFDGIPSHDIVSSRHTDNKKTEKHKKSLTFKKIIAKIKSVRK